MKKLILVMALLICTKKASNHKRECPDAPCGTASCVACVQVFAAFDTEGEGSLGYAGIAALVRRQLPNVTAAELRVIMSHMHLLDKDGDGRLTCQELWDGVRHAPTVGPTARRDLRRVAGLAKTPAEREAALRRSPSKPHRGAKN